MTRRDQIIRLAEKVMGWHIQSPEPEPKDTRTIAWWDKVDLTCREYIKGRCIRTRGFDPYTSRDSTWMLVDALQSADARVRFLLDKCKDRARAAFYSGYDEPYFSEAFGPHATEEAICAAALRFVELMEESNG